MESSDICIIGGGVVGLSLAYQLSRRGAQVRVLDRGVTRQSASWAGAGILPPAGKLATDPVDRLTYRANQLHWEWTLALRELTGIDTGYRQCGGVYVARSETAAQALAEKAQHEQAHGVRFEPVATDELAARFSAIATKGVVSAYFAPDECQLRNPRHMQALVAACQRLGVQYECTGDVTEVESEKGRVLGVRTKLQRYAAAQYCLCGGAWSGGLLQQLGFALRVRPLRGQMVLFQLPAPPFAEVLNEAMRYIVPRDDGRVLAGSTMEEVGFDLSTTPEAITELKHFATSLVPALATAEVEATWSGLRPASHDGKPYLGRLPGFDNFAVAAGHTRGGLQLSTATAEIMAKLLLGDTLDIDLQPFAVDRQ
jgi:glycine oxidase